MRRFWPDTSRSHASSNAIKTTDRVVAELIAEAQTCSDFLSTSLLNSYVVGRHQSGSSLGTGAIDAI